MIAAGEAVKYMEPEKKVASIMDKDPNLASTVHFPLLWIKRLILGAS
jgi:hypothetical protein